MEFCMYQVKYSGQKVLQSEKFYKQITLEIFGGIYSIHTLAVSMSRSMCTRLKYFVAQLYDQ